MAKIPQQIVFYANPGAIAETRCMHCKYLKPSFFDNKLKRWFSQTCTYVADPVVWSGTCILFTNKASPLPSLPALPLALMPKVFFASAQRSESAVAEIEKF